MRRPLVIGLTLTCLLLGWTAQAQTAIYGVQRRVGVLEDKGSINSDKKNKLRALVGGVAVNHSFVLLQGAQVKVLARDRFEFRESVMDTATGTAFKDMKVVYSCALVEVVGGVDAGRKGWAVAQREVVGRYTDSFITAEPLEEEVPK